MTVRARSERVNVLGVGVDPIDMDEAIRILATQIKEEKKGYVCLAGVHGIMEAQRDPGLLSIFADALLVAPDGMPTVWLGWARGFSRMKRVFGPDLMIEIFAREEFRDCAHFLCGGAPGVGERLREEMLRRFPHARILGVYSPPFRKMTAEEERELAATVRSLQPDIIWIGISTPKQERFMARYLPKLDTKLMIGVGAAFLYHTGMIRDSPEWVKRAGMQWLHRLFQEPARLWKRYLLNNPRFVLCAFLQLLGVKKYTLKSRQDLPQTYTYERR
jgi:N-acetylglucosaminyldiphosphoundecaprenol N-acetyl-beta-D-mannosaminyltransferase